MNMLRRQQGGFTLIELLMVVAIIGIVAAIAIPSLWRARQSSNEASAIASMRTISSAQAAYAASCGWGHYAPTLESLSVPPVAGGAPFVGPDLSVTGLIKHNYTIAMAADSPAPAGLPAACNGRPLGAGYHATAIPSPGAGTREFGVNTSGGIFFTDLPTAITISDNAVGSGSPLH